MNTIVRGITALFLIYVLFVYNDAMYFQQLAGAAAQWLTDILLEPAKP